MAIIIPNRVEGKCFSCFKTNEITNVFSVDWLAVEGAVTVEVVAEVDCLRISAAAVLVVVAGVL
jgi:hypothetical protein